MKKFLVLALASLFTVSAFVSCSNDKNDNVAKEENAPVEEVVDPANDTENIVVNADDEVPAVSTGNETETTFSVEEIEEKIIGYWEFYDEMYGYSSGYRFNADMTLDFVYDKLWMYGGVYKVEEDGIHFSADDGYSWDPLVMEIVDITDTELTVAFDGVSETYTKSDAVLESYDDYMASLEEDGAAAEDAEEIPAE